MMKKVKTALLAFFAIVCHARAQQVGINTTTPHSSAVLDITSTSKGLLIPRLTTVQMNAIATPATGLAVYNTDSSSFCFYTGTQWVKLISANTVMADNLGNHTATQNIKTGAYYLSPDGTGKGIQLNETGAAVTGNTDSSLLALGNAATGKGILNLANNKLQWSLLTEDSSLRIFNNFNNRNAIHIENPTLNNFLHIQRDKIMIGAEDPEAMLTVGDGIVVDKNNVNNGTLNNTLKFGNESGEGIGSNRNSNNENYSGLDLYTSHQKRISVMAAGNVGINTTSPGELLHVNNGSFLVTGIADSSAILNYTAGGPKMFFYPRKGAFRAGVTDEGFWTDANIGKNSIAMGENSSALSENTIAIGKGTYAEGNGAMAAGTSTAALAENAMALGNNSVASAAGSFAMGNFSNALSEKSFVIGNRNNTLQEGALVLGNNSNSMGDSSMITGNSSNVYGGHSFSYGNDHVINGNYALAAGNKNINYGDSSMAIGSNNINTGKSSITFGNDLNAGSYRETILGSYNQPYLPASSTEWNDNDRLLVVGKGATSNTASNAITILKNGNMGVNNDTPSEKLDVAGKTKTTQLQVSGGATSGYVLQGDADGNASWTNPASLSITETDPKVGNLDSNYLSKWNGSTLANSTIIDNGTSVGINTTAAIPSESTLALGAVGQTEGGQLQLNSGQLLSTAYFLDNYESAFRIMSGTNAGSSTVHLFISATGNFGIGTSAPSQRLEVNGRVKTTQLQMTSGATSGYVLQSDASGFGTWVKPTSLANGNWTTSGTNQYSALSGNVGIGITSPSAKLHVDGNVKMTNARLDLSDSTNSIIIGTGAGSNNAGDYNLMVGTRSGQQNTTGIYNTYAGNFSGSMNTTGSYNAAFGFGALEKNTTAYNNTAVGFYALRNNTTGVENTATGTGALENNTTAINNTANGFRALFQNTTGSSNVAVGFMSLEKNTINDYNTAIGAYSLQQNAAGEENTSLGAYALTANTSGDYNAAVGANALAQNTTGSQNLALGYETGYGNTSGDQNTLVGFQSGYMNSTGSGNVFLGYNAGYNESGSNKLYISNSNAASPLIWGDFATKKIIINDSLQSKFFKMTNGAGSGYLLMGDAAGNASWVNPALFISNNWSTFGNNIYNNNSGNVGIGNPFPGHKLDVVNSGGTVNANVRSESSSAYVTLESPNQNDAMYSIGTFSSNNGVGGIVSYNRWKFGKANSNESGSNNGADFVMNRYNDAGAYAGQPLKIERSTGSVTIGNEGVSNSKNTLVVNGSLGVKLKTVVSSNNNTLMDGTDYMVIYGGTLTGNTITIPAALSCSGRVYLLINHSSSAVTINGGTTYITANGVTSNSIAAGASVQIVSDGSNWHKIN